MATVAANGITIEYEMAGSGPPLLLIMGLGGQLVDWPPAFVEQLQRDFTVIRFDNRDAGLSSHVDAPVPTRVTFVRSRIRAGWVDAAYSLGDMASDAAGLLDALGIDSAHVVGMSMGGMIAQRLCIDHPSRARSLCSIMSNTGNRISGQPTPRVMAALARRVDIDRDEALDVSVDFFSLIGGPDWDPADQRTRTAASLARAFNPDGVLRQSLAIAVADDRTTSLRAVTVPTLVVHGLDDPLVRPSGGIATARAVPSSRLLMFPGMGHDLPATRHREIVTAIVDNAALADDPTRSAVRVA